ncbi:hypothetical protein GF376_03550 [Candidatus Peregrinibacteria bacterium]|nr:hypothetical protein [Candidatus Peregrinibacteria bacterium]
MNIANREGMKEPASVAKETFEPRKKGVTREPRLRAVQGGRQDKPKSLRSHRQEAGDEGDKYPQLGISEDKAMILEQVERFYPGRLEEIAISKSRIAAMQSELESREKRFQATLNGMKQFMSEEPSETLNEEDKAIKALLQRINSEENRLVHLEDFESALDRATKQSSPPQSGPQRVKKRRFSKQKKDTRSRIPVSHRR